ncbi:MAG: S41 family peptidase [Acidobacteriota bacterium]|nr:S41 family peptidase [Acidobacteriota bacterium]
MRKTAWILVGVLFSFALLVRPFGVDDEIWQNGLNKIEDMMNLVQRAYYKPVNENDLAQEAVKGMLQTLDPHSYLLEPDSFSRMAEEQRGKYFGVGMQIQKQAGQLVVVSPMEGTPAWRLGVQPADIISRINGEDTQPISAQDAVNKLRGPKGTKVDITFIREGLAKPIELTIERAEIPLYSVPYAFLLPGDVGYVLIRYFAEATTEELRAKLAQLTELGMKSLILDLRGNAGGPLVQAIEISDLFLPRNEMVVSMKGRNRAFDRDFAALRSDPYEKVPLLVLIDQGSASASEIVAGAIMDNDRGLVVGADSWGKGLVQQMFPLGPDMAVAITIAKYYTPSGRSIQRDYSRLDDYLLDKVAADKPREVKTTSKGRKVLGQGGITPDVAVPFTLKTYTFELRGRGAFFAYTRKLVSHLTPLGKTLFFPGDPAGGSKGRTPVAKPFLADDRVLEDFRAFLRAGSFDVDAKRFKEAEPDLKRELEREIASALWGQEEGWKAFERTDPQILRALELVPEAAKFIE